MGESRSFDYSSCGDLPNLGVPLKGYRGCIRHIGYSHPPVDQEKSCMGILILFLVNAMTYRHICKGENVGIYMCVYDPPPIFLYIMTNPRPL